MKPIAVIGMAARLPGAVDLTAFWRMLRAGQSAVSLPPEGRPGGLGAQPSVGQRRVRRGHDQEAGGPDDVGDGQSRGQGVEARAVGAD